MEPKKNELKFKVSDSQLAEIEAACAKARFQTRAAYLRDCVLFGSQVDLSEIAIEIGQLGLLCNEVLADEDGAGRRHLTAAATRKLVRKITAICETVTSELRRINACDPT